MVAGSRALKFTMRSEAAVPITSTHDGVFTHVTDRVPAPAGTGTPGWYSTFPGAIFDSNNPPDQTTSATRPSNPATGRHAILIIFPNRSLDNLFIRCISLRLSV
jgi:hypothetical protein